MAAFRAPCAHGCNSWEARRRRAFGAGRLEHNEHQMIIISILIYDSIIIDNYPVERNRSTVHVHTRSV